MPASRCVVQDCNNIAGPGISIHKSPTDRKNRIKWVNFVRHHRANFFIGPEQRFAVCSQHFAPDCFHQALAVLGSQRRLKTGSYPTIWKKVFPTSSARDRRKVYSILAICIKPKINNIQVLTYIFYLHFVNVF